VADLPVIIASGARCAIGLDVGGTKIAGGIVAFPEGRIVSSRVIPTLPERGAEPVLADALTLARELLDAVDEWEMALAGIGIGVPELVDASGNVTSEHTIPWVGVPVQERFTQLAPAVVESDVRAGALAEACFGAGRAYSTFVYVTVGTGISCTLVVDGRPHTGARGNALILSNAPLSTTCTECGAELHPILEEIASGPALVARYNQRRPAQALTRGEEVLAAVAQGDSDAIEVVRTGAAALGTSVAFLVNTLDPEALVVGGGLGTAGGLYWTSFVESTREHIWADNSRDLPILPAALGPESGLIGAAATIWQRKEQRETRR
jgi:glucokinase